MVTTGAVGAGDTGAALSVVVTTGTALVTVTGGGTAVVVVPSSPPGSVGTAYGGSNMPNGPHALHGHAHSRMRIGAARIGSHRELGILVRICDSGIDCGQSVPRSLRESWRVSVCSGSTSVDTSGRSKAQMVLWASGPVLGPDMLAVPYMVLIKK